ncbi:MAG: D-aminoacyl-tRNA deacylase [Candidatus Bathyarchaeota archaeon]
MILCVESKNDIASKSIAEALISGYNFDKLDFFRNNPIYYKVISGKEVKLIEVEGDLVFEQNIFASFHPELIIFLSRHESKFGHPTLSIHVPGNLGNADFGGVANRISIAPANAMRNVLLQMVGAIEETGLCGFEVCYEGTHHGPSIDFPSMFVEIGSSSTEWRNPKVARVIAQAIIGGIKCDSTVPVAIGIGGSHCNKRFTRLAIENDVAFGHIIPSNNFETLNVEMLRKCVDMTLEKVQMLILDWKGIDGKDRELLLDKVKQVPLDLKRVSDFRKPH